MVVLRETYNRVALYPPYPEPSPMEKLEERVNHLEELVFALSMSWSRSQWDYIRQLTGRVEHLENKLAEHKALSKKVSYNIK